MRAQFITADQVSEIMGICRSKAYAIVRQMNKELKSQGFITVSGKCPMAYFKQKFYGFHSEEVTVDVGTHTGQTRPLAQ